MMGERTVCKATTAAGQPCQNTADGADGVRCTGHQRRTGNQPGRVIRINSSHRNLIRRARAQWSQPERLEAPRELEHLYGGSSNWWCRVITTQRDTPKFLHGTGIARLVRYMESEEAHVQAHVPEPAPEPTLAEVHEEWRKSQEVVADAEKFSALQATVHDLSARLVKLESMVAEILQTLTKGA